MWISSVRDRQTGYLPIFKTWEPQYLVDCCTPTSDVVSRQRLRSVNSSFHDIVASSSVVGHFLLSARWPGTLCLTISATQHLVMTSLEQHWRHTFSSSIRTFSALEASCVIARYKCTYLFTDRRTDGRTDRITMGIACCLTTRAKNATNLGQRGRCPQNPNAFCICFTTLHNALWSNFTVTAMALTKLKSGYLIP